ncbi:uncharacterized protein LOC130637026 [Hydractinia symbiolongicarpus]|uniref:uncharacterized protein LOC130637026 n=1 Tax=Hydractinia symbiolongicarpus TaxID=13093 RepID=UPI00254DC1F8|nr:uncharacterized protein LOC130637026 [Hydractinia symbiolongicarpus]
MNYDQAKVHVNSPRPLSQNITETYILFIGIQSHFANVKRREVIRKTWLQFCSNDIGCHYNFFLDGLDINNKKVPKEVFVQYMNESKNNNYDIAVIDTPPGRNFAVRTYKSIHYVMEHMKVKYYLRLDDDQYLCVQRLIYELKHRPVEWLFSGYTHCGPARIDEGYQLFSYNLLQVFYKKSDLVCTEFGTDCVSSWVYDVMDTQNVTWFTENKRIHQHQASLDTALQKRKELCQTYISLHGTYEKEMQIFHDIVLKEEFHDYDIPRPYHVCPDHRRVNLLVELKSAKDQMPCGAKPVFKKDLKGWVGRQRRPL